MFRRLLLALLVVLQLQPMLAYAWGGDVSFVEEAIHASTHLASEAHHHEDDHHLVLDDAGPVSHVHHDLGHHSVLLFPTAGLRTNPVVRERPPVHRSTPLPDPFLEGPLRPPRPPIL